MKEWRWDRLLEHARREGWVRSLGGVLYAVLAIAYTILFACTLALVALTGGGGPGLFVFATFAATIDGWVLLLATLAVGKLALRKQRFPRWTAKTILLVATAFVLTGIAAAWCMYGVRIVALPYLPIFQPLFLIAAWTLWFPVDRLLKERLLRSAAARRATLDDPTVIGIVGSVGKTTTKELLTCVLRDLSPVATPEHVNTELGVASWLLKITAGEGVRAQRAAPLLLIVEMGAYRRGEIATLCRVARPTIGVVTALGSDHLALFGSEEAIVEANAEILPALPKTGHLFLLRDSVPAKELKKRASCPVTLAGAKDASNVRETDRGLTFESGGTRFTLALHGMHNVGNAMLAITVARRLGIEDERIRKALAGFRGSAHTFHLKRERGVTILDDTYNVSPLSFRAALTWVKDRPERPRVLLTSGLLETGSAEEKHLRELGSLAKKCVDRVVFATDRGTEAFSEAFGSVELLGAGTQPVPEDGLLVCVGRMPLSTIQRLLP